MCQGGFGDVAPLLGFVLVLLLAALVGFGRVILRKPKESRPFTVIGMAMAATIILFAYLSWFLIASLLRPGCT